MLIVIAVFRGKPGMRPQIEAALSKAAAASRGESGCLSYVFSRDLEDSDRYVAVEAWVDQAALDAHFATPHLTELLALAAELMAGPTDLKIYESAGPKS